MTPAPLTRLPFYGQPFVEGPAPADCGNAPTVPAALLRAALRRNSQALWMGVSRDVLIAS